jgi:hypothetical protein
MKLGSAAHIIRGVTDLTATVNFYKKLGYNVLEEGKKPNKFALFTDGIANLLVSEDNMVYTGLIYFDEDVAKKVVTLEGKSIEFFWKEEKEDGTINQAMFEVIPERFGINLVNHTYSKEQLPSGKTSVDFGKFGEFSIPVQNFEEYETKLNHLGFETKGKYVEPYNWGILSDGIMTLGLHETKDFTENTLTYFHPRMDEILSKLDQMELNLEMWDEDNGKVTAPDGLPIFLFKGDI